MSTRWWPVGDIGIKMSPLPEQWVREVRAMEEDGVPSSVVVVTAAVRRPPPPVAPDLRGGTVQHEVAGLALAWRCAGQGARWVGVGGGVRWKS